MTAPSGDPATARRLFSYLGGTEWAEYRAILGVFAGTFFAEFTPQEVADQLDTVGVEMPVEVVATRLESLVGWGNLTVSSSVGNPASLADYYKRRNRYLITRAGQEVHGVVEDVLARVDEVRDVSTGRLGAVRAALESLAAENVERLDKEQLVEAVRQVFDPHEAFANEITQFFAAINQWQSRYDLTPEELTFFAEVLVGYVGDRIQEIERTARPIGRLLEQVLDDVPRIVSRVRGRLAERVERAGLAGTMAVSQLKGSRKEDWEHLAAWFVSSPMRPSRIDRLTGQAVAAVRTLTMNLSRLSRVGTGASSRRADFLRLAGFLAEASPDDVHLLACAAFGLHGPVHFAVAAGDRDDPVPTSTSWWEAPRAPVPISIRARGDTTNRGRASPVPDRTREKALLARRRLQDREARRRVDGELLDARRVDGSHLSMAALMRLQQLLGRVSSLGSDEQGERRVEDGGLSCRVRTTAGAATVVTCPEGMLTLEDVSVEIVPVGIVAGNGSGVGGAVR